MALSTTWHISVSLWGCKYPSCLSAFKLLIYSLIPLRSVTLFYFTGAQIHFSLLMLFQHTVFNVKICNLVCVLDTSASPKWFDFILYRETIFFFNSLNETCVYIKPVYNLPKPLGKASAISLLGDMCFWCLLTKVHLALHAWVSVCLGGHTSGSVLQFWPFY